MKNLLSFLLALAIVSPAWGGDVPPASWSGIVVELNGPAVNVSALVDELKKAPAYKVAACNANKEFGDSVKIECAKANSELMDFLVKNSPAVVQWSISSIPAEGKCNVGCVLMACPTTVVCCNIKTHKAC
jgi:hypothetical protein